MYFPFTALFLAFAPLALSLPQATAPASPPSMTMQVSYFEASVNDAAHEYANRTEFLVWDDTYAFAAMCNVSINEPLYSCDESSYEYDWHVCDVLIGSGDVELSFYIGNNFDVVGLKKGWDSNGTYMWGMATRDTCWKEGPGGNVTKTGRKRSYTGMDPWEFNITSVIA